jgi:hypothetical protein
VAASCFRESQEDEESQVDERIDLGVSPHHFYRVQLRGIGRKQDRVEGWDLPEGLGRRLAPVNPQPVPDEGPRGMDLPSQLGKPALRSKGSRSPGEWRCWSRDGGGCTSGPDRGRGIRTERRCRTLWFLN